MTPASVYMLHEFKVREKKLNKYIGKCVCTDPV